MIKRDTDIEELQARILFTVEKLERKSKVKTFYLTDTIQQLEGQLLAMHDYSSQEPPPSTPAASELSSAQMADERRMRQFLDVEATVSEEEEAVTPRKRPRPKSPGADPKKKAGKHKNQRLWRELRVMVGDTAKKVSTQFSSPKLTRAASVVGSGNLATIRLHSIIRVFSALTKRFTTEGSDEDPDNQSISEDQFISLFMKKVHPDGFSGSAREVLQLVAHSAIEAEEVEEANRHDESRLMRSVAGHLCKVLNFMRGFKKKVLVDSNIAKQQATQQLQAYSSSSRSCSNSTCNNSKRGRRN